MAVRRPAVPRAAAALEWGPRRTGAIGAIAAIIERDLRVGGRRGRLYVFRSVSVALLAFAVAYAASIVAQFKGAGTGASPEWVFLTLVIPQLFIAISYAARSGSSALTSERERKTDRLLLSTGVSPFALVGGLFLGRGVPIAIGLLSGLPIAMLLLTYGGVTLTGALLAYAVTFAAAALSLAAGVAASCFVRKPRTAESLAWFFLLVPFAFLPMCSEMPRLYNVANPILWQEILLWCSPFTTLWETVDPAPPAGRILLQCATWAAAGVVLLRLGAAPAGRPETGEAGSPRRWPPWRRGSGGGRGGAPSFGHWPIWNLERASAGGFVFRGLVVVALFVIIGYGWATLETGRGADWAEATTVTAIAGLAAGVSALYHSSRTFRSEVRTQTLPILLATPVTSQQVVHGRALGIAYRLIPFALAQVGCGVIVTVIADLQAFEIGRGLVPLKGLAAPALAIGWSWLMIILVIYVGMYLSISGANENRVMSTTFLAVLLLNCCTSWVVQSAGLAWVVVLVILIVFLPILAISVPAYLEKKMGRVA